MKLLPPTELLNKLRQFDDFSIKKEGEFYRGRVAKDGEFMRARDRNMRVCLNLLVTGWDETEEKLDKPGS